MKSAEDILKNLLELMERDLQRITIDTWFGDAEAVELRHDCFIIRTTSSYKKEIILTRFSDPVNRALTSLFSADIELVVLDEAETVPPSFGGSEVMSSDITQKFTFEDFVVGPSNRFAHAASIAVANNPARSYNPLFIYGSSGLGKTHLMKAISTTIKHRHPEFRVIYVNTADFTNEFIIALANHATDEFRSKYNYADVLLLDDVQFISGKLQTQVEFFNTFNSLYDNHKQIVLTSDRPPREIAELEERMRTRFESGLLADIQAPDFETRLAILQSKCRTIALHVPEKLLSRIAENDTANIRQLEGIINHLNADHDLTGREIDDDMIYRAIKDVLLGPGKRPSQTAIIDEVCSFYNITPQRLKSKSQTKDIVLPRQVASYLMQTLADMTYKDIGTVLGNQHHTTVISSVEKIERKLRDDPQFAGDVKDMISNLGGSVS